MLLGVSAAVVLALIMGIPTLRLRADYLAIVTIAVAEILRLFFTTPTRSTSTPVTASAASPRASATWNPYGDLNGGFLTFSRNDLWVMTVGWTWSR